jgi:phosphoribosylamine--glycine ligase
METGYPISGIDEAAALEGVLVFQAGTRRRAEREGEAAEGEIVTAGGRVLTVVAEGADLRAARDLAYQALARISFEDMHFRTDIAARYAR